MSPTLNANLTLFINPCKIYSMIIDLKCCNYYQLLSDFSSKFQSFVAIFHHIFVMMQIIPNFVSIVGMWMNKKVCLDESTCKHIHK